jgi:hypothetical protein
VPSSCSLSVTVVEAAWNRELRVVQLTLELRSGMGHRCHIITGCPLTFSGEIVEGDGFTVDLVEAFRESRENGNGDGSCEEGAGT